MMHSKTYLEAISKEWHATRVAYNETTHWPAWQELSHEEQAVWVKKFLKEGRL